MDFQREQHRIFAVNENGTVIAEIGGRIGYGFSKRTTQNFCGE